MQAFVLFEESIPDSAAERTALSSIVGALHGCRVFPPDSRSTLVHKATGYSAKLLRKADQCRAVLACSHLHWQARRLELSLITCFTCNDGKMGLQCASQLRGHVQGFNSVQCMP